MSCLFAQGVRLRQDDVARVAHDAEEAVPPVLPVEEAPVEAPDNQESEDINKCSIVY